MPHRWRHLEITVNDADDRGAGERTLIDLALLDRRAPFERRVVGAEGRGSEDPAKMSAFMSIGQRPDASEDPERSVGAGCRLRDLGSQL